MSPRLRRVALTAHIVASVGWLGAVVVALALATIGLIASDPRTGRAVYPALDLIGWSVLVPLSLASLITGLIQSLGTTWGLLRHYWVVIKLLINVVATAVLILTATMLAVFKPRGLTRYGQRRWRERFPGPRVLAPETHE